MATHRNRRQQVRRPSAPRRPSDAPRRSASGRVNERPKEDRARNDGARRKGAASGHRYETGRLSAPTQGRQGSSQRSRTGSPEARGPARTRASRVASAPGVRRPRHPQGSDRRPAFSAAPGGRYDRGPSPDEQAEPRSYRSSSVRELRQADRNKRVKKAARRYLWKVALAVAVVAVVVVGAVAVYNSSLFAIKNVTVNGVEHLTSDEMAQLAAVPSDTTLLRVDTDTIAKRLKANAWVDEVQVNRQFPDTLELDVTEREVAAVVEIPTNSTTTVKSWAIAKDHTWLMPIPDPGSEAAKTTSSKIYEDADRVLHVKEVPFGTKAQIGEVCSDANVNNALDIVSGMTTGLADRVTEVRAAGVAETTLVLDNGVEVVFGKAEDIRDKERVVLEILEQNPDGVSYVNVRMVETPTWRAI